MLMSSQYCENVESWDCEIVRKLWGSCKILRMTYHPSATAAATASVKTSLPRTSWNTNTLWCSTLTFFLAPFGLALSIFWLDLKIFLPQAFPKELPLPKGTFQQSPLKSHLLLVFKKTKERPVLTFADMLLCHLLKRKWTFVNIQSNSYINI